MSDAKIAAKRIKLGELQVELKALGDTVIIRDVAVNGLKRARKACQGTSEEDVPEDLMRLLHKVTEAAELVKAFDLSLPFLTMSRGDGDDGKRTKLEYKEFVDQVYRDL